MVTSSANRRAFQELNKNDQRFYRVNEHTNTTSINTNTGSTHDTIIRAFNVSEYFKSAHDNAVASKSSSRA